MIKNILVLWLFLFAIVVTGLAKSDEIGFIETQGIVGINQDRFIRIPPPDEFLNKSANAARSNIEVKYIGFPEEAKIAFEYAVSIWESLLYSPKPIYAVVYWEPDVNGQLGRAGATHHYVDYKDFPKPNLYYPSPLAEKLTNRDLNRPGDADIVGTFNSTIDWYYGTDGNTPSHMFDFVTVVIHELCHSFGFITSFNVEDNQGYWGFKYPYPFVYDNFVEDRDGHRLVNTEYYTSPSVELANALTGNDLYLNSPMIEHYTGDKAKLYVPSEFSEGSSIDHLHDEYCDGTNALMTHEIYTATSIHYPGNIPMGILADLGWNNIYLLHEQLTNDELEGQKKVDVKIINDYSTQKIEPRVYYSADGGSFVFEDLQLKDGSTTDYFTEIKISGQHKVDYYISIKDDYGREFYLPNTAPLECFHFFVGEDDVAPSIFHVPYNSLDLENSMMNILAEVNDVFGVDTVYIEQYFNENKLSSYGLLEVKKGTYNIIFNYSTIGLKAGDVLKYRLVAEDVSSNKNVSYHPAEGFHFIEIENGQEFLNEYESDFEKGINDFNLDGLDFDLIDSFDNNALHSHHHYENSFWDTESDHTAEFKLPFKFSENNSFIQFDEIVLVEPANVSNPMFYNDYVVVEAKHTSSENWIEISDRKTANSNPVWNQYFNSNLVGTDSEAKGKPELFKSALIDITQNGQFKGGDIINIRFRMHVNSTTYGWGWAIDNLKIQTEGLGKNVVPYNNLVVYPNPTNGDPVNVYSDHVIRSIQVFDQTGRMVNWYQNINEQSFQIEFYRQGIYLVKTFVQNGTQINTRVLINE